MIDCPTDCPMCSVKHADWALLDEVEPYYAAVGVRPVGSIWQCQRCRFRIPTAHLWIPNAQKQEETGTIVQDYQQLELGL